MDGTSSFFPTGVLAFWWSGLESFSGSGPRRQTRRVVTVGSRSRPQARRIATAYTEFTVLFEPLLTAMSCTVYGRTDEVLDHT